MDLGPGGGQPCQYRLLPWGGLRYCPTCADLGNGRSSTNQSSRLRGDSASPVPTVQRLHLSILLQHPINIQGATFVGEASFRNATFPGGANFSEAEFQKDACFTGAQFHSGAGRFISAGFHGDADFGMAGFAVKAEFQDARFSGAASFQSAPLAIADFSRASFGSDSDFSHAALGLADFTSTAFLSEVDFTGTTFSKSVRFVGDGNNLVFARGAVASFLDSSFMVPQGVIFHHVFLGRALLCGIDVREMDFTDVEWAPRSSWVPLLRPAGLFGVADELAPRDKHRGRDYALIGKLYRQLKHNYEEQRDPITAGDFHYGEMRMRRLSRPHRRKSVTFLKRNLSFLALYEWVSGYGEDYRRPVAWIAVVIFISALLFALVPAFGLVTNPPSGQSQPVHGFWRPLLHSVMCFLLRGDRPFGPEGLWGQYLSLVEGTIGAPLIAMLVLALNRRFKR